MPPKPLKPATVGQIAMFVPNLIGYARMAFSLISFWIAKDYPGWFLFLYTVSFILDAADGMAARALGQVSNFGAILDALTDRASTAGMLVSLVGVMKDAPYWLTAALASMLFLDIGSHFCRMYASVLSRKSSHKDVSDSIFWLLRQYYSRRRFMGLLCIGQEFAYILLYAWYVYQDVATVGVVLWYALVVCTGPCLLKHIVNVQQLIDGLYHIGCADSEDRAKAQAKN